MYHKKDANIDTSAYGRVLHALNKLDKVHYTLSFLSEIDPIGIVLLYILTSCTISEQKSPLEYKYLTTDDQLNESNFLFLLTSNLHRCFTAVAV